MGTITVSVVGNNTCGTSATPLSHTHNVVGQPTVSTSPTATQSVCIGATVTLTAGNVSGTGNYTAQWFFNPSTNPTNTGGTAIAGTPTVASGGATTTYTLNTANANGASPAGTGFAGTYYYYCVFTPQGSTNCGIPNVVSNVAQVIVVADPTTATPAAFTTTVCIGGAVTVNASPSPIGTGDYDYQWYFNTTSSTGITNPISGGSGIITAGSNASYTLNPSNVALGTPGGTGVVATNQQFYFCRFTPRNGTNCGAPTATPIVNSPNYRVDVVAEPTLTGAGATTICLGGTANITATAAGGTGTFTYQWEYSSNGSSGWANVANGTPVGLTYSANTAGLVNTLTITGDGSETAQNAFYRCQLTSNPVATGCNRTSGNVQLTFVNDPTATAPVITNGPVCATGALTTNVTIASVAAGGFGTGPTYLWQYSSNGTSWATAADATPVGSNYTEASLTTATMIISTPPTLAGSNHFYRLRVQRGASGCQVFSAGTALTVFDDPVAQTISATYSNGSQLCLGATSAATFSGGSGGTGTITDTYEYLNTGTTWQSYAVPPGAAITFNTTGTTFGFRTRRSATGNGCTTSGNNTLIYTTVNDPTVTASVSSPASGIICSGGTATLSAVPSASAGCGLVEWESSADGSTGWTATGSPGNSLTTAVLTATTYYRAVYTCDATVGCNPVPQYSNTVTVTVNPDPTAVDPAATSICLGGQAVLTGGVTPGTGTGTVTYQWEQSSNGTTGWANATTGSSSSGHTGVTLTTVNNLTVSGMYYRLRINHTTGIQCTTPIYTNPVFVTVVADPTWVSSAPTLVASSICNGGTTSMSVAPTGGVGAFTYAWQKMATSCATPTPVGTNSPNYTSDALATGTHYYRCLVTQTQQALAGCVISTAATCAAVTVVADPTVGSSGSTAICTGGSATLTATPGANGFGCATVTWESSSNGTSGWTATGLSGNSVNTGALTATTYYRAVRDCDGTLGCDPDPVYSPNVVITVYPGVPGAPTTWSVNTTGPTLGNSYTYTVTGATNAVSYIWTLPANWTGTSTTNSINVTLPANNAAGSLANGGNKTISVLAVNPCGNSTSLSQTVVVHGTTNAYTSNGTFAVPAGISSITVQCWGGGGAGGSARANSGASAYALGGGGAGGAYATSTLTGVSGTYTVTVGAAVAGTTSTTDNTVVNGNPSWFGTTGTVFAQGGAGGVSRYVTTNVTVAGAGGTGSSGSSIGTTVRAGGNGGSPPATTSSVPGGGGGGSAGTAANGNPGTSAGVGATAVAGGGAGGNGGNNANGSTGGVPGGGGGGGRSSSTTQYVGGNGAAGQVIVAW